MHDDHYGDDTIMLLKHDGLTVHVADATPAWVTTETTFRVHGAAPVMFDVHPNGDVVVFESGQYPLGTTQIGVPFFDY